MERETRHEQLIRGDFAQETADLVRSLLVEEPLKPNVCIQEIHLSIPAPLHYFLLQLGRSILGPVVPQGTSPILPQFGPSLFGPLLKEKVNEIDYLLLKFFRQFLHDFVYTY